MKNTRCPICHKDSSEDTIIHRIQVSPAERYQIRRCSNCDHQYTWFEQEVDINEYYDGKDYTVRDTRNSIFYKIQKFEYGQVIRTIKSLAKKNAPSVLDFGSGKGLFMHFAKELGCKVKGIESSKPRAEYARAKFGLDINTDYYTQGQVFDQRFDVLTSFHVLEHIDQPGVLLSELVKGNLQTGGLLVAEVPNINSWQSEWAGNSWLHLDVPRHINHFTPAVLQRLLHGAGCTIIKEEYFSYHLGIIGMLQTIFSWFGYKGFLIGDLKKRKSKLLLLKIAVVLPFASILELVAASVKKGGVIRYYARFDAEKIV